jgi:hypothetical protein
MLNPHAKLALGHARQDMVLAEAEAARQARHARRRWPGAARTTRAVLRDRSRWMRFPGGVEHDRGCACC